MTIHLYIIRVPFKSAAPLTCSVPCLVAVDGRPDTSNWTTVACLSGRTVIRGNSSVQWIFRMLKLMARLCMLAVMMHPCRVSLLLLSKVLLSFSCFLFQTNDCLFAWFVFICFFVFLGDFVYWYVCA
jgi:hypothetical protein